MDPLVRSRRRLPRYQINAGLNSVARETEIHRDRNASMIQRPALPRVKQNFLWLEVRRSAQHSAQLLCWGVERSCSDVPASALIDRFPLGKYWRSSPLVFSLEPRCQGLRGSQKYTCTLVAMVKSLCRFISIPRSQVSERRRC
jgi:hypothetical protein